MAAAAPVFITADWPAPRGVRAVQTTRLGGVSVGPYAGFNLATHCGDEAAAVTANRALLRETLALPSEPAWLQQVHGTDLVDAAQAAPDCRADASATTETGVICTVMTADCLPVLFCSDDGRWVAAAHAGWRGLVDGVLEATLRAAPYPPSALLAWFGAAIGPDAFEVGPEVREAFVDRDAGAADAFTRGRDDRWQADLYALARRRLAACGLTRVYGGGLCTYRDAERFFSFRREKVCGRMATLIWREAS